MSKLDVTVEHTREEAGGRYWATLDPDHEAEMTYRWVSEGVMSIDHTLTPPKYEGRGVALQLVEASIKDAREQGFTIIPRCPYVAVQFRRHPEWGDLLAR
ncbi:N-acetyltransferase [Devosia pacifica]|uniref:N-acetyltransferase n=1 Tax=Devosia pacifica TaxID=1335967 RepID=A0A918VVF5_9HYPH|nr:GNAT family N-acetyltransferase [Devosia pacifica]GHA27920.1 N-acetyltransferase [Devosia pacifica]